MNIYDYTLRDTYPACGMNWPFILKEYYAYLKVVFWMINFSSKRRDVVMALHAQGKPTEWVECDHKVQWGLEHDKSTSAHYVR